LAGELLGSWSRMAMLWIKPRIDSDAMAEGQRAQCFMLAKYHGRVLLQRFQIGTSEKRREPRQQRRLARLSVDLKVALYAIRVPCILFGVVVLEEYCIPILKACQ
jgi:hypothetical protein